MSEVLDRIQPGDRIGPYRVVRGFRARGGMARVFEVEVREKYRRPGLPRRLAMKVANPEHQDALQAEADFLSRFNHPNVVRIFPIATGDKSDRPVYAARAQLPFGWFWYYTMELLNGGSLQQRLTRTTILTGPLRPPPDGERPLSILETLGIARQLAAALEHIHAHNVINLDVKPGNVLFRRRNFGFLRGSVPQVVLCDFGISRDLRYPRAGLLGVATPEYLSPEQASELGRHHQQVDIRSDIFSLGVVLYEMLTGTLPFENIAMLADPTFIPPPPRKLRPSIPPLLEEIVMRALAKNPAQRFQTASEIKSALERVPTPFDWGAAARRTFAGVSLAACLVTGGWGVKCIIPTPTPAPPIPVSPTAIAPPTPTATPRPTATPSATPAPTSTLRPTLTPTNTPIPVTPTPTVPPSGG